MTRHLEDVVTELARYGEPSLYGLVPTCGDDKGIMLFVAKVDIKAAALGIKTSLSSEYHRCPLTAALECEERIVAALRDLAALLPDAHTLPSRG